MICFTFFFCLKSITVSCSHLDTNHYLFDYADDVTDALDNLFNMGFGKKVMTLGEIKKYFAASKK